MIAKIIRGIWQLYAAVIVILTAIGILYTYKAGQNIAIPITSAIFTGIYLIGLYGYVYDEAIFSRKVWRACFWLNIFGIAAKSVSYFLKPSNDILVELVATVLLSAPLIVALYKYSNKSNKLWPASEFAEKAIALKKLISENNLLSATVITQQHDGEITTDVKIQNNAPIYKVRITKNKNGNEEIFKNEFDQLEKLVEFIEDNTPIRTGDFV